MGGSTSKDRMKLFGLIGFPLTHSFSKKYFSEKFEKEGIDECLYENFELKDIDDLPVLIKTYHSLKGLNVTIPYKEDVIKYLDDLDYTARKIQAVNVIKMMDDGKKIGYNTDYYGFRTSLENWMGPEMKKIKALILGTGGASKAVKTVLDDCGILYSTVSRDQFKGDFTYYDFIHDSDLIQDYRLIINTTPLGMYPNANEAPNLPYENMNEWFYLYDLIYNPEKTLFLENGEKSGVKIKNGREMLVLQAEKAWEIWNE